METQLKQPGVTVWGALSSESVMMLWDLFFFFFFYENVNEKNYLEMLRKVVVPQLHTKPNFYELFFQQDGAFLYNTSRVGDYLNEVFPQRWFGRRGSIEWPPRLADLIPMDFFLGGVVKKVC